MKAQPDSEAPKQAGSFGIPENIRKAQENFEKGRKPISGQPIKPPQAQEQKEEAAEETMSQAAEEVIGQQRRDAYAAIKRIETNLGITIETSDIIDFVRKGRIEKKDVKIIPGALSVGFRTLNGDEIQEVQKKIFDYEQDNNTTKQAVENEAAFWNLAYGLSSYQGKDMTIQTDKSKVKKLLTSIGAHIIDKMSSAYIDFNYVVRFKINDPEFIKKS
jgi:hypothetical protein